MGYSLKIRLIFERNRLDSRKLGFKMFVKRVLELKVSILYETTIRPLRISTKEKRSQRIMDQFSSIQAKTTDKIVYLNNTGSSASVW